MAPPPLAAAEVDAWLSTHPGWRLEGPALVRTFEATTFLAGLRFVTAVGQAAEAVDHHPDIDVRWRKVTLRLVTHDAGHHVTSLDTALAAEADRLFLSTP